MGRSGQTDRKGLRYELLRIIFQFHAAWRDSRDTDRRCGRAWISGAAQGRAEAATAQAGIVH